MRLLNYDFYDLYALIVFLRTDTDKVFEYAGGIEQIVACLESPVLDNEIEVNTIRKLLRDYVREAEKGLSWIWTDNVYTGNVVVIKNINHYHNLPTLLVECKKPRKVIGTMIQIYQKEYNKEFLREDLKCL